MMSEHKRKRKMEEERKGGRMGGREARKKKHPMQNELKSKSMKHVKKSLMIRMLVMMTYSTMFWKA